MATRIKPMELRLSEKLWGVHWPLVALIIVIGLVGYVVLYSAGGGSHQPWAARHGLRLAFGTLVMLLIALVDVRVLFRYAYAIYGICLALLVAVEIMGSLSKGAQRWIDLGIVQLQPSELMKIALALALARYFHASYLDEVRRPSHLLPALLLAGVPAALVLKQPDLGTAVMLMAMAIAVLFLAGVRLWKFALAIGAVAAALPILWSQLHDYQKARVLTFLEPERDPLGTGYHIIQSKIALGSGGLWGKGLLNGTQAQLSFLPEKQTDFAFTMLAEATGLVGAAVVLALCLSVILLVISIALRSVHQFGRLLAMAIAVNFFLYVVINVAMVTGLIPVVGVPLPLISYGGTAMLTTLVGFGLVLSIDVHRHTPIPRFPSGR
ncbi:MAG: rod shape-determining protein RodA [Geminicoccaceae bacterium]|nr:rod shape-determining protein RodA [Geminicoccaceae bacterium]MCB9942028.1 rod shape-determining protein RodA [Geminicoccaceae bacterium]